jgi:hypothetical protein
VGRSAQDRGAWVKRPGRATYLRGRVLRCRMRYSSMSMVRSDSNARHVNPHFKTVLQRVQLWCRTQRVGYATI